MSNSKYLFISSKLIFVCLLQSFICSGQSSQIDSLNQIINSTNNDSLRFEAFISLSEITTDDTLAIDALYDALQLARRIRDQTLKAKAEYNLGFIYFDRIILSDSSRKYFQDAIKSYQAQNDVGGELKARYGHSLVLDDLGQMKEAIEELLIALQLAENTSDSTEITKILNVIGNINNYLGYHDIALKYYKRSSNVSRLIGDTYGEAIVLYNTAIIHGEEGDFQAQLSTFQRALILIKQLDNAEFQASLIDGIGGSYIDLGIMDSAEYFLQLSASMYDSLVNTSTPGTVTGQGFNYQSLGKYYEKAGDTKRAIGYFQRALSTGQKIENLQLILNNSDYLSGVYESVGNYREALNYFRMSTELSDSVFTEENTLKLNEVQAKYENVKQVAENEQLRSASNEQEIVIQKQRLYNIFFAVISAIILISAFFLLLAYRKIVRQKKLAEEDRSIIKKQSTQLEHNTRLKSQFFSNIAHELRTPLTILLGMIDNLTKRGVGHFDQVDFSKLKLAKSNGVKIQNLIDEIFELTKSEAHKLKLQAKPMEVLPLMERIVFSFHSLAEGKNIDLNISYNQVHGIYANIDQPKFEKIINNLIVNALKFTQNGGAITVKLGVKSNQFLTIKVEDTGVGIPADEIEFVFDRFFQVSTGDNAANPGTGLGLAMAKELTKLHKGEISVKSEVNKGTTFKLEFPVVEALPELLEPAEEPEAADVATDLLLDGIIQDIKKIENGRILIVEDNQDMRKYLVSIFEDYFTMVTARNGREALRVLETQQVNLIISDLMMPEMNGTELLVALKNDSRYCHIPVIMLTAKTDEHQKLDALKLGVDDYLTKPFSADEVLARVNNLIRNHLQRTEHAESEEAEVEIADDDNLIRRITLHVKERIGNFNITVTEIAHQMAMSERQLYRKVNALTGLTPNQLIREIKLREAMEKLNSKSVTKVSVLAKEVGFESSAYFSKLFYARFGKKPQEII